MVLRFLWLAMLLLTFSPISYALGKLGHKLVCQLSYDLLTPSHQQTIDTLLATIDQKNQHLINQYNKQPSETPIDFAASCTWPDAIKKSNTFKGYKSWHYLNIDRDQSLVSSDHCRKNCVTSAINHHKELLANADRVKQLQALMFVSHWLGDIHQPLHVSYASDLGGNRTTITPFRGRCNNLHWYWDECLLYPVEHIKGDLYQALLSKLQAQLLQSPIANYRNSSVTDWANESLALIRQPQFNYCQLNQGNCNKINNNYAISLDYHQHYQQVLHTRIIQAAVRLAFLLEQSLKAN